jgi:hypothetical protein
VETKLNFMKAKKKHTLLKGEGVHQHTLYGNFKIDDNPNFTELQVKEMSVLVHEHPSGSKGEHETLQIEKGDWSMGKQVEYNPFTQKIERIFD